MARISETEVASVVMAEMQQQGWDCYPEVEFPWGGRADIVGIRPFPYMPNRMCVFTVECKTSWSLTLLEQADHRKLFSHYVAVAAPTQPSMFYERLCKERGVGMIRLQKRVDPAIDVHRCLESRMVRHKARKNSGMGPQRLIDSLHEDMKRYTPGSTAAGGYSTPFSRTMGRCVKYVTENPGCGVSEIASNVEFHYASIGGFRQGIRQWLETREGIRVEKTKHGLAYFPSEQM